MAVSPSSSRTSFIISGAGLGYAKILIRRPLPLPCYLSRIQAGFPSPTEDFLDNPLDLNEHLIKHPSATYLVRAIGDSMTQVGIYNGDILIVDRSITPLHGHIVIAAIDGDLTVKRLKIENNKLFLVAENPCYKKIEVNPEQEVVIWGVVIHAIHSYRAEK